MRPSCSRLSAATLALAIASISSRLATNASTQPAMVRPGNLSCNAIYVTMQFTVRLPSVISNVTPAKDAANALSFNRVKGIGNPPIAEPTYRVTIGPTRANGNGTQGDYRRLLHTRKQGL